MHIAAIVRGVARKIFKMVSNSSFCSYG